LDEPTNDLDIATLNVLEDYLISFKGCVIVVSHDRFFMDKVVDHLLVFQGDCKIKDFPGNYTDYREWNALKEAEETELKNKAASSKKSATPAEKPTTTDTKQRKLTFNEKRELETLETDIQSLEQEQQRLEAQLSSGSLSTEEIMTQSKRFSEVSALLDEKTMRWLELSELAN
ncbi:MAG TPA: hypothetical protein VJ856_07030, partial [Paludibacteraceae bacterium]|nr:hypothetical protein [Paludibacteraceae bacterium]